MLIQRKTDKRDPERKKERQEEEAGRKSDKTIMRFPLSKSVKKLSAVEL